ncbi:MAG: PrsW family glutamic-type intramembrane protease [Kiritimatiellia bacterium]
MDDINEEPVFQGVKSPSGGGVEEGVGAEPIFQGVKLSAAAGVEEGVGAEPVLADVSSAADARLARKAWYAEQWEKTRRGSQAAVFFGLCVVSGLFAVVCAFGKGAIGWAALAIVIGAPVIEEIGKVAGTLMVMEKCPWLFRSASSLLLIGLVSGLTFAAIENLLYFFVYIEPEKLTPGIVLWRLIVCTAVHIAGAVVSCSGLARAWTRAAREKGPFSIEVAIPFFIGAIVLHGTYNLVALLWSVSCE